MLNTVMCSAALYILVMSISELCSAALCNTVLYSAVLCNAVESDSCKYSSEGGWDGGLHYRIYLNCTLCSWQYIACTLQFRVQGLHCKVCCVQYIVWYIQCRVYITRLSKVHWTVREMLNRSRSPWSDLQMVEGIFPSYSNTESKILIIIVF